MAASDGNRACEDAAAYYHDFLLDPGDPSLPRSVTDHITLCEHCRGQIERLGELLAEAEGQSGPCGLEADNGVVAELQRHFEHVGDQLGCAQAKPLLPTVLLPSLRIRIPTPVTVHVDHCAECIGDLAVLKGLALDDEQLIRLSRLYEDSIAGDSRTCQEGRSTAAILGAVSLEGLGAEASRHLCVCRTCRDAVYEYRQERLDRRRREGSGTRGGCGRDIAMADLFDYAVPYGRAVGSEAQEDIGMHLRSCPQCLEKLQALHRAVYGVIERPDSPVVTVYTTGPVAGETPEPGEGLYEGHSVGVEVSGLDSEPVAGAVSAASGVGAALRRTTSNRVLRPFLKTAFLTAAMIPLAVVFWATTRSASGLKVRQVSEIFASAAAVHVETIHSVQTEPTTDVWVSGATVVWKNPATHVVYDLKKRRKLDLRLSAGSAGWVALDNEEFNGITRSVGGLYDFAPPRATLKPVVGADASVDSDGSEVYEVAWETMKAPGAPIMYRRKISLDPVTKRPRKIELFSRMGTEGPFELDETRLFTYPNPSEVAEHIRSLSALP
ncbi:MAG: hypothetical protein JW741_01235 [Sedimentisphaerales bacterium]|nr:hypothetical protein [Sedimentisphaerales bacterium]